MLGEGRQAVKATDGSTGLSSRIVVNVCMQPNRRV